MRAPTRGLLVGYHHGVGRTASRRSGAGSRARSEGAARAAAGGLSSATSAGPPATSLKKGPPRMTRFGDRHREDPYIALLRYGRESLGELRTPEDVTQHLKNKGHALGDKQIDMLYRSAFEHATGSRGSCRWMPIFIYWSTRSFGKPASRPERRPGSRPPPSACQSLLAAYQSRLRSIRRSSRQTSLMR